MIAYQIHTLAEIIHIILNIAIRREANVNVCRCRARCMPFWSSILSAFRQSAATKRNNFTSAFILGKHSIIYIFFFLSYVELPHCTFSRAEEMISKVRAAIFAATGCVASAGIGPNMLLARMATKRGKVRHCI